MIKTLRHFTVFVLLVVTGLLFNQCNSTNKDVKAYNKGLNIVPLPQSIMEKEGVFRLDVDTKFLIGENMELEGMVSQLNDKIMASFGQELSITTDPPTDNYIWIV